MNNIVHTRINTQEKFKEQKGSWLKTYNKPAANKKTAVWNKKDEKKGNEICIDENWLDFFSAK